jgi:hypothetical protein
VVSGAQNGTVTLLADGHTAQFTPNTNYHGSASFSYTATDTATGLSSSGSVAVSVNSPPAAAAVTAVTNAGSPVQIRVLSGASDPDGDTLTVVATSGAPVSSGTTATGLGTITINSDGTVTYRPNSGFVGTDTFTVVIADGYGGTATGTVTVTVNLPTSPSPTSVSTTVNAPVTVPQAYYDQTGTALAISAINQPPSGSVVLNSSGQLVYLPPNGFTGPVTFSYVVTDGHGGFLTITVMVAVTASQT